MHGGGVGGLAKLIENGRFARDQTDSSEGMEVQAVVLAADQEEEVRGLAIGRAEVNFLRGAAQDDE